MLKLVEKLVRAKVKLENARKKHADHCMFEDPDYMGPCTCGASTINEALNEVLEELEI